MSFSFMNRSSSATESAGSEICSKLSESIMITSEPSL